MARLDTSARSRRNGNAHGALKSRAEDVFDDFAELRKDVSRLAKAARNSARYEVRHAGDRLGGLSQSLRERATHGAEYVSGKVRERPAAAVGLSLGVGLLFGILLAARR